MPALNDKSKEAHRLFLEHNVFIVWKPEYNLGIPIIDEHHRGIVSTINSLHFGMVNNYVKEILSPIVDMMNDYTRIHFHIEEDFLQKIGFPNVKKHCDLHLQMTSRLKKLGRDSIMAGDSQDFMNFLKQWWVNHIRIEDLTFRDHFFKKQ